MHNAIMAELYKARKNKIFYVCTAIVLITAAWVVYKDKVVTTPLDDPYMWISNCMIISTLFMSLTSGFIITFLMQREYDEKTIVNVLVSPTSKFKYIGAKLAVWFMWYAVMIALSVAIYAFGGKLIYGTGWGEAEIKAMIVMIAETRLLSFIASLPLLLVAVLQKRMFYPSIMCSLFFTGMELFSTVLPVKYSSMIPWTAAIVSGFEGASDYRGQIMLSVFFAGFVGITTAVYAFKKQNQ